MSVKILKLFGSVALVCPVFLASLSAQEVLIPVQAAHHNEMMSPAVTE